MDEMRELVVIKGMEPNSTWDFYRRCLGGKFLAKVTVNRFDSLPDRLRRELKSIGYPTAYPLVTVRNAGDFRDLLKAARSGGIETTLSLLRLRG